MSGRYSPHPEYRDSGVEWLGAIPSNWRLIKLAHGYPEMGSGTTPPSDLEKWYGGSMPWVTTGELRERVVSTTTKTVTLDALKQFSALRVFPKGSVVIAMYGATCGRLGILGVDATTNQACCVLPASQVLDNRYLYYWFQAVRDDIISLASGGGQPNISQAVVSSLRVSTPCTQVEQTQIAKFLDYETRKIDALIEKQQQLIALLKEKRQAVISHAVTKGLNPKAPMRDSGVEWLGEVPAHWATAKLGHRYEVLLGKMLDASKVSGDHLGRYLRNTDVQWDRINEDDLPEMDFRPREHDRYSVSKGDLIVCEGGEIGRCAIWSRDYPCFYQKALHRLRPRHPAEDVARFMFYHLFLAVAQERFVAGSEKATIAHLPAESFRQYRFAFPPHNEQQAIADTLDTQTKKFDELEEKAQHQIELLQERRTALISAAVTGKIDVRGFVVPETENTAKAPIEYSLPEPEYQMAAEENEGWRR